MKYLSSERPDYKGLETFVNAVPTLVGPLPFADAALGAAGKGLK